MKHWCTDVTRTSCPLLDLLLRRLQYSVGSPVTVVLSYVLCELGGRELKVPPRSRDTRGGESFLEKIMSELSIKGWRSILPILGSVWSMSEGLEVRWSLWWQKRKQFCGVYSELQDMTWKDKEVITLYAPSRRSSRALKRWDQGQEGTIQTKVLSYENTNCMRTFFVYFGRMSNAAGGGCWG